MEGLPQLLTVREAAEALRISQKNLWVLSEPRGPIPVVRIGARSTRYTAEALRRYIEQQSAAAAV
jgi:predicted DNA-binding transcriptional regulator AlpA